MVTQDTDKLFIQVRPPCGRNTYVLRLIVLNCVEIIISDVSSRGPLPLLIYREGTELQVNYHVWYIISCSLAVHVDQSCAARLHLVGRATSDGAAHIGP